jgi:acetolactate synthase I/III small subunit
MAQLYQLTLSCYLINAAQNGDRLSHWSTALIPALAEHISDLARACLPFDSLSWFSLFYTFILCFFRLYVFDTVTKIKLLTSIAIMASRRALTALPSLPTCLRAQSKSCSTPIFLARHQSSSTSALAYKALHQRISPLPTDIKASWSAPAAVSSILYETPLPSAAPPKRHILNCLVQNEPGVLSRVSGILAARGFNIDSLVVCNTEVEDLSRMTIVLQGQDGVVEQARRQLEDLVPVWAVLDYTDAPLVQRELLLAKVSILGPEYFEELLAHHREMSGAEDGAESAEERIGQKREEDARTEARIALRQDFHPSRLAISQALRHKHEHLEAITHLTHQFGGKVLDISNNNCIVELSAKPTRIDSFLKLVQAFGILESARTGESFFGGLPGDE